MDGYSDDFFDPTDQMEVTVYIVNNGNVTEHKTSVKAALYQTESGELPAEKEENLVSVDERTVARIAPHECVTLSFNLLDLRNLRSPIILDT